MQGAPYSTHLHLHTNALVHFVNACTCMYVRDQQSKELADRLAREVDAAQRAHQAAMAEKQAQVDQVQFLGCLLGDECLRLWCALGEGRGKGARVHLEGLVWSYGVMHVDVWRA